jgi:hypothetical protein
MGKVSVLTGLLALLLPFAAFTQEEPPPTVDSVFIDTASVYFEGPDTLSEPTSSGYFDRIDSADNVDLFIRSVPDSVVKDLQEQDAFWYANADLAKKEKKPVSDKPFLSEGMRSLVWALIVIAFIGAIIWYLSMTNAGLFHRKNVVIKSAHDDVESENIFEIHYGREIDKALAQSNYRLATRLQYLQLLKSLSEKDIIRYKQDRTNFDYLTQLHGGPYYHDFFRLTRNYEYAWYGQFDPGHDGYKIIKREFEELNSKLHIS